MGVGDLEDVLHRGAGVDDAQARVAWSHLEKCAQCGGVEEGHLAEVDVEGVPVEDGEPWLDPARGGEVAFASNGGPAVGDVQFEPIADGEVLWQAAPPFLETATADCLTSRLCVFE